MCVPPAGPGDPTPAPFPMANHAGSAGRGASPSTSPAGHRPGLRPQIPGWGWGRRSGFVSRATTRPARRRPLPSLRAGALADALRRECTFRACRWFQLAAREAARQITGLVGRPNAWDEGRPSIPRPPTASGKAPAPADPTIDPVPVRPDPGDPWRAVEKRPTKVLSGAGQFPSHTIAEPPK